MVMERRSADAMRYIRLSVEFRHSQLPQTVAVLSAEFLSQRIKHHIPG